MFAGIVEGTARILAITPRDFGRSLEIAYPDAFLVRVGESIALNGCCLTVTAITKEGCIFDVVEETLGVTTLGSLAVGESVNVERSLRLGDRIDGHLVQGHVDTTAVVTARRDIADGACELSFSLAAPFARYLIAKGSVAVDGVSLTVKEILPHGFSVAIIPHTAQVTTLGERSVGSYVNIELDSLAKYIERLAAAPMQECRRPHEEVTAWN